ncbi:MAG TPA: PEP-CTERM sorting domain-containing protein [Tepidisphaeraceae bacterium]|jgi:hypothetical protein|nr:PEP-CTERM sorting domain-containing protein [Tepidisphaeraceae bacterium]
MMYTPPRQSALALAAAMVIASLTGNAHAEDVSAPAILQWFDGTYQSQARRAADVFKAGYGSVWLPPPGRADSGNQSVGYDVYDRFDLGKAGNPTLYGTEKGLKNVARTYDKIGVDLHLDLIINHNGFSDAGTPGFIEAGGYPGFVMQNPDGGSDPYGVPNTDGDFNSSYSYGDLQGRLSGLIDIDHGKNWQFIRNPVDPNDSRNLPAGTTAQWGRLANVADPNNARFYPDLQGPSISVFDPRTGETDIKVYSFNKENPMAGDATPENATGYLMRYTQWLVQEIGADGFRIDAAKHVEGFSLNYYDRAVYRSNDRKLLDGSTAHVFSYGEVFDSNRDYLLRGADWHDANQVDDDFVRKDINPNDPGRIGGNRDVLDFALVDALNNNLTGNGFQNNWNNVVNAGLDSYDDGKRNGSAGVMFVGSHDKGNGAYLNNVAHAYVLMQPGNAVVYFNAKEHGNGRDFPKDGRGDALGGRYGDTITELVNIRNTHGRGDYRERWISTDYHAFERSGSALVMLSNRNDGGSSDWTNMNVDLPWGTPLIELTGNAKANGLPELLTVTNDYFNGPSYVRAKFLNNDNVDKGYLIYGLATPQGQLLLSNVAQTIGPDAQTDWNNGSARTASVQVVKSDNFDITLNTNAVNLLGYFRDYDADGDGAVLKIDGGIDVNGNGYVDHVTPNSVVYGFERFSQSNAGYGSATGNGSYSQSVDASQLSEGYHFIEVRAFRHRSDGGPAVYSSFKETIYVDRLKPVSQVLTSEFKPWDPAHPEDRDLLVQSTDGTADSMHVFMNLGAALTDAEVQSLVNGGNRAGQIDTDLFKFGLSDINNGNNAITIVTYEMTGTYNVQRFAGINPATGRGHGLGDTTFDGYIEGNDLDEMLRLLSTNNRQFNPAADLNADGYLTNSDWFILGNELQRLHNLGLTAPNGSSPLVSQGTLDYYRSLSAAVPVPEPTSLGLLATASGLLLRRRKKRVNH